MSEFWDTPEEKRAKLWQLSQQVSAYKDGWSDGYKTAMSKLEGVDNDLSAVCP